jgi:alpha-2-macroglobulin
MSMTPSSRGRRLIVIAVLAAVASLGLLAWLGADPAPTPGVGQKPLPAQSKGGGMDFKKQWKAVDTLVDEQKMQEAADKVAAILDAAKAAHDEDQWTRALVKMTQLRISLHGWETSVRFLKDQPWPQGALQKATLDLYYAHSLMTYARAYSWEVNRREKVESKGEVDLKAWTREQIFSAALGAELDVWALREQLGTMRVSALSEYLDANNYPPEVRGTLRDAVSYLLVELLADTANWRPEHSNGVYLLDLGKLLQGEGQGSAAVKLDDAAVHPLVRICAVLDDLEQWSAREGRREAALEARLERARRLRESFTEKVDRKLIREDLANRLPAYRSVPWWAAGIAELASFVEDEEDGQALVRARELALQGHRAYPGSIGGQRCLHVVKSIEAPDYSLQSMSMDGLGRRSILVTHKNLQEMHFRAYAVDLLRSLQKANDWNLLPSNQDVQRIVKTDKPVASWKVSLPPTPDYRSHRTFVTPDLRNHGLYVIVSSARPDFSTSDNELLAVPVLLSDLVLLSRGDGVGGIVARVVSGGAGGPVEGAKVTLWVRDWQKGHHPVKTLTTDQGGAVVFDSTESRRGSNSFLVAERQGDASLEENGIWFSAPTRPEERTASLVYTDRSIYRPMQKVFWKVLAYRGVREEGRLAVAAQMPVAVTLVDPNGETVATTQVTTNDYGTASGEFLVPSGRLLGGWQVRSSLEGSQAIRVEEYKRPTFEATFKEPSEPMRLNKPAKLVGDVRYYFGLPVTSGNVRYRVTREPVYPWWWGWWWGAPTVSSQQIASGVATLSEEGTFEVAFTPAADERLAASSKETTYRFTVTADVTDEGGETRSAARSVRLGFVAVEASIDAGDTFIREGATTDVPIRRLSLDGVPRPGAGEWRLVELVQPAAAAMPADEPLPKPEGGDANATRTPGDALRPRWETGWAPERTLRGWAAGRELAAGKLAHNAKGEARATLPKLAPGAYRLLYTTVDEFGARYETAKELVAGGAQTRLELPVLLRAEDATVPVGGTARLLVLSGLPGQVLFVETFRDGKAVRQQRLVAGQDTTLIEIPVGEGDRGGFGVSVSMVHDHQMLHFSQAIFVPWDNKQLEVSFASFRDKLRPRGHETWRVAVKGAGAEAGAAELLAYMYDKSLDIFAPHRPPSVTWLYPSRSGMASERANLAEVSGMYFTPCGFEPPPPWPSLDGDRLKFYSGYGIGGPGGRGFGGMMPPPAPMMARAAAPPGVAGGVPEAEPSMDAAAPAFAAKRKDAAEEKQAAAPPPPPAPPAAAEVRSNFAETAFWQPHLLTDKDGTAAIEFTVPDSVTAWNVWVHAVTRDLRGGSLQKEAKSVKDLMVRPYVPRFLREGDQAEIKVVVNNASEKEMKGQLDFDIQDPDTNASLLADFGLGAADAKRAFTVKPGGGSNLTFKVTAPKRVGIVAFKVVARSGEDSDGELRPLPVLPSRLHLAQSRFVTLRGADRKVMRFDDLAKNDDPSLVNEQMVVTVDAQLFYQVLAALPYLVNYPYECTEQTLNRFLSTGIVSTVYKDYPAVARMAEQMAKRDTVLETFDQADPNRKMTLEETPWLNEARGGQDAGLGSINVLDPRIAKANREQSLAKLAKAQTSNGSFPWWPGGPPSPYMTLYIAHGFAKAVEFGVDVPKEMVVRAWGYLATYYRSDLKRMMADDCCWELLTFLNYVASSYPDASWTGNALTVDERKEILAFSFKHWKEHSPYLKGYLALTLKRMGRESDARLVWASVMDSARTTPEEGTFWAQEDRSWLWYNDRIETHAFALRTLMEMEPQDARRDGLVQWLLLNKKLNQWKSTRATAEVVYSLVKYLKVEGALGVPEDATVKVGNQVVTFTFDPEKYEGKHNQVVVPGDKVGPETAQVEVSKTSKGFEFASATWRFSTEKLPDAERGDFFNVSRKYFKRELVGREWVLKPLAEGAAIAVGDQLEVQISLRSKHQAEYVHLRDPRGAGFEPESQVSRFKWDLGLGYYEEVRDSGANFFFEYLPVGEYTFKYRLRANMAGAFRVGPATVQSMYAPEFNAYSAGNMLTVTP